LPREASLDFLVLDMDKKDDKNIFFILAFLPDKTVNGLSSL
jgi:hypothetical protein